MEESLLNRIKSYISASIEGQDVENPKIDFKRQWYKLNNDKDLYEFLKDTTAIVNTFGLDGFIIIGFDDKTKSFYNSTFTDCGLYDSERIPAKIVKHVDNIYNIGTYDILYEGHKLSVIHLPPSLDKPHVIKGYKTFDKDGKEKGVEQHRIFVKKSTSTGFASKDDLELMYYDRKNIIPEYKIITHLNYPSLSHTKHKFYIDNQELVNIEYCIPLTLENNGRRPVAITSFYLSLTQYNDPGSSDILNLHAEHFKTHPIIIHPNEIITTTVNFFADETNEVPLLFALNKINRVIDNKLNLASTTITLKLTNGSTIISELIKV